MSNYYTQYPPPLPPPPPSFYGAGPRGGGSGGGRGSRGGGGQANPRKRRFEDAGFEHQQHHQPQPYQHQPRHANPNFSPMDNNTNSGPNSHPRSDTNLIINYLPQTFTDEELRALFAAFGPLDSCRVMKDRNTGYSFGYGFVNYKTASSASMAIDSLNGIQVQNKVIKVSLARPPSTEIKDTNLYITNLPRETTEVELVAMFAPYGRIVQKNVLYDKYTQLPRGVAFVRYDRREEANSAILAMNDYTPPGATEPIRVKLAENHGKQKASYVAGFQAGFIQPSRGAGRGGRFF